MDLKSFSGILGKDEDTKSLLLIAAVVIGIYAFRKMPGFNIANLANLSNLGNLGNLMNNTKDSEENYNERSDRRSGNSREHGRQKGSRYRY